MDQLLVLSTLLSMFCLVWGVRCFTRYRMAKKALLLCLERWKTTDPVSGTRWKSAFQRQLFRMADICSSLGVLLPFPDSPEEIKRQLERSGDSLFFSVERFLGLKTALAALGFGIGTVGCLFGVPLFEYAVILLPLCGFFSPVIRLRHNVRKRQEAISRDMPDFLDMMSVTLQAGVSLDQAVKQICGLFAGPMHEEIARLNREIELGVERDQAWLRLLDRNPAPELQKLANAVLQGNRLGVPVAATFRLQADDMRRLRIEKAKEQAAKASPKITVVNTVLIAPAVFAMILGLLILNVFYNPSGLGIDGLLQ